MKKSFKKGSSIAELLAVIIIMGIIAAIAVPTVSSLLKSSRQKAAVEDIRSIVSTMTTFASTEGFNGVIEFHGTDSIYSKETTTNGDETEDMFYSFISESVPSASEGLIGTIYVTIEDGSVKDIVFQGDANGAVYIVDDHSYSFTGTTNDELKAREID